MPLPLLTWLLATVPVQDGWPCWRGTRGDGLSHDQGWSAHGTTLWTAEIGLGYSAPSVAGEHVVTLGFDVATGTDVLRALERSTGRELWRRSWPGELRDHQHEGGTLSTPAISNGVVVVSTTEGEVRAFRLTDGEPLWRADHREALGLDPQYYGFAGSPVVRAGVVYAALDRVLALDLESAELLWSSEPLDARYSTPQPYDWNGTATLAVLSQQALHLVALEGGQELARTPWHRSDRLVNAATPIDLGDGVFVSSGYDHGGALVDFTGAEPSLRWETRRMRTKMAGCVALEGGLFGFDESVLRALDLDGGERWHVRGLGNGALSGGDGKLAILSSTGELIVARASLADYEELARVDLFDEGVCWTPPVITGGRLYVRNNRGTLICRDHATAPSSATAPGPRAAPIAVAANGAPDSASLFARHMEAIGGSAALAAHPSVHLSGTYEQRSVGFVPGPFDIWHQAPDRRVVRLKLPPPIPGVLERVFDGELAFERSEYRGNKRYEEGEAREEALAARLAWPDGWAALHPEHLTTGAVDFADHGCWRVEARTDDGATRRLYFDRESGFLIGREAPDEGLVSYDEWRTVEGLAIPHRVRVFRPESGIEELFRVERVTFEAPDETLFERPDDIR
jgi:outer membrane protein assembly factor BamB